MEGEPLEILFKAQHTTDQLHQRVHQQHQLAGSGVCDSHRPEPHAVVELPTVDVLDSVFGGVATNLTQVEAHLANVQEAELVGGLALHREHLDETVLADGQLVLDLETATTELGHAGKLVVHLFHNLFEQRVSLVGFIIGEEHFAGEEASERVEGQNGAGLVQLGRVVHDQGSQCKRQLLVVKSISRHAQCHTGRFSEEVGQQGAVGVFSDCLGQQRAVQGTEALEEDLQFLGQLQYLEESLVHFAQFLLAKVDQDFG